MKYAEQAYQRVALRTIIGPGDVKQRQATTDVVDLAESIKLLGDQPQNAIVARHASKGWEIISGRDRYSALLLLKTKHTWVHVVTEATPLELLTAEIHENLRRRDVDRDALTLEAVRRAAALGIPDKVSGNPAGGRPVTVEGAARALVAKASGRSTEAVRKAVDRAEAAEAREEEGAGNRESARPAPPPPLVELYGHALPDHVGIGLNVIVGAFDKADRLLRQAQAAVGELGMTNFSPGIAQRLKTLLHDAAVQVRAERPHALCPQCYGASHPIAGPFCKVCQESGTVTRSQFEASPVERRTDAGVYAAGLDPTETRAVYEALFDAQLNGIGVTKVDPKAPRGQRVKRLRVEVDGREMSVEELEAAAGGEP